MKRLQIKPVNRKRIKDEIIDQIVLLISKGKIRKGEKLPSEHILMKQFGVGRSSLREAIGALSLIGVLNVQPGRGTYISVSPEKFLAEPLSWDIMVQSPELEELFEVRTVLEVGIIEQATKRANREDIVKLREIADKLSSSRKNGKKRTELDLLFHFTLAEISRNKLLLKFFMECQGMLHDWMRQIAFIIPADVVVAQHESIINAVAAHDIEKAKLAMQQHITFATDELSQELLTNNGDQQEKSSR